VRPSWSAISSGTRCKARYIVHIIPTRLADAQWIRSGAFLASSTMRANSAISGNC
jgi:hypothetical protein